MIENSQRILSTWRHLWPRSCLPSAPHTMARYHISLVPTSPDTSRLSRDSSSETNQRNMSLTLRKINSQQVKTPQKIFIFLITFFTSKRTQCPFIVSSVASDFTLCMILNITYFQMFKEDLSVEAGHRWGTPTAASVSSSPTSAVGTYQLTVRVLWHGGGVTHDEHNPVWHLLQGHWRGLKAKSGQDRGDWTSAGGWEHQQLQ